MWVLFPELRDFALFLWLIACPAPLPERLSQFVRQRLPGKDLALATEKLLHVLAAKCDGFADLKYVLIVTMSSILRLARFLHFVAVSRL